MNKIDRNSYKEAKKLFEKFLPDDLIRELITQFLASAIDYAASLDNNNWNLNLDKNGLFIRFNTGHEYCIEISKNKLLILCDKDKLKPFLFDRELPIYFRGHIGRKPIESKNINEVPDIVKKTKNSIGCVMEFEDAPNVLEYLESSNQYFIKKAINTVQIRQMREAHSKGGIEYLSKELNINLPNPTYSLTNLPNFSDIIRQQEIDFEKAKKSSRIQRKKIIEKSNPKPEKFITSQTVFARNQYVVAEVLERANGFCEKCKKPAPFLKDKDNEPFLEVHHIVPLSEGGEDTVDNSIALCPNCHRHAHFGKKTFNG